MLRKRGFLTLVCVVALIAAALLAPGHGGSPAAILVPLAPLFGLIVLPAVRAGDPTPSWSYPGYTPLPSRAPPVTV
jgi:hypothetical protein